MRSIYKLLINCANHVPFDNKLKKKFSPLLGRFEKSPDFIIWRPRSSLLYPKFFGKRLVVYSGNFFTFFQVRRSMLFFKPNLFVRTKRLGSLIHTVKRKKKK